METQQLLKPTYRTKLVRIDATTWIETKADVPDEVARKKFQMKLAKLLKPQPQDPGLKVVNTATPV